MCPWLLTWKLIPFFHSVAPPGPQMHQNTAKGMDSVHTSMIPCPEGWSLCFLVSLSQLTTLRLVMPSSGMRFLQYLCCQYHKLVSFLFTAQGKHLTVLWVLSAGPASFHHGKDCQHVSEHLQPRVYFGSRSLCKLLIIRVSSSQLIFLKLLFQLLESGHQRSYFSRCLKVWAVQYSNCERYLISARGV